MSRQNRVSTLSVLLLGLIVIAMIMAGSGIRTSASVRLQSATATWTPCPSEDQDFCYDDATGTIAAYFATQTATRTAGTTGTPSVTGTAGTVTGTPTTTGTTSLTPTRPTGVATPTPFPTSQTLPATVAPQLPAESASPTPTPVNTVTCFPGDPVEITGSGPPRAAFLVYFGGRVVSGGSVAPSGRFSTKLVVGNERGGIYVVTVRLRGTSQVLRQISCSVPDVTPTPPPRVRAAVNG
jgi:hypothetical protein